VERKREKKVWNQWRNAERSDQKSKKRREGKRRNREREGGLKKKEF
jgi:hypothetical protein